MTEPHDPNVTADLPPSSVPPDSLDAGLAAGFGRPAAPRSSLGDLRPVRLKEAAGESTHAVNPASDALPSADEVGDRYRLDGEIARGGMGVVLRGRDVDLGRDLAVKVLLEKYADRPDVARRFVEEAQIGGQLQHPGVVPVYDIGRFGDRPFFTMKLVKGDTLAAILRGRADATADRPHLLGIALRVAQTLAYAHAKGVIHRDLKPANVMVGAFGEVQVMDWGLAKVLAEGGVAAEERAGRAHPEPDETTIRTARSAGTDGGPGTDTEAGSLLGTPAYMPPEQAAGDIAHLDRRADVFGLGALLCEVLTGKPPYVGRSSEEVRRKAVNGDLADATARLDACGADAELVALTKACLAPEAADRPTDARAVADGLSAYLNGVQERLQAAERERAVAVVREAEQRKKRKAQLALAAAVVGLMLGGGAFAFWQSKQAEAGREREARNAEAVIALLNQGEEAMRADDAAKAAVALEAATKRAAEGGAAAEADRLGRLEADLALLRDLDAVDQFRWTWSDDRFPDAAAVAARTRAAVTRFGIGPDAGSEDDAAARVSASAVRERMVSALDRLLRHEKTAGVRALLRRADPDPYRDAVRDAVLVDDRAKMADLAARPAALGQPAGFTAFMGDSRAIGWGRRQQLLLAAVSRWPRNVGLLMLLGGTDVAGKTDTVAERVRWFQAAVTAAPANYAARINLGLALKANGQTGEAIACCRAAIDIDPKHPFAYVNLGHVLKKDRADEAVAAFRTAIDLDPKLAKARQSLNDVLYDTGRVDEAIACNRAAIEFDPTDARAHVNLGHALHKKGRVDDAIAAFHKAIDINPKLASAHFGLGKGLSTKGRLDEAIASYRTAIEHQPKDSRAHHNLGTVLTEKGRLDEAIASYRKAVELDPKYVNAHGNLGLALRAKGQVDEAVACFRKVIELDPTDAGAHAALGDALYAKQRTDEAVASYRKAVDLDPKLTMAHYYLGQLLTASGRGDEAIASYRKAVELDPKFTMAHYFLGGAPAKKGLTEAAIASYRKAIELQPNLAAAHRGLGEALNAGGRRDEAIASYRKAIEFDPKAVWMHDVVGRLLWHGKRDFDGAIASYRKAVELSPNSVTTHSSLARALALTGQVDEAIACYRKVIELSPKAAATYGDLGEALARQGRFAESLAAYKRAHELGTQLPNWRSPSAEWVRQAEADAAVEAKLPAFLKGEFRPVLPKERQILFLACWAKKRHQAAVVLASAVFAENPNSAADVANGLRYKAACSAALAAAGHGEDAAELDDAAKVKLRGRALDWLKADLAVWDTRLAWPPEAQPFFVPTLRHWQRNPDLAGVRDAAALAELPAGEQKAFTQLWADVAALHKKAEAAGPKPAPGPPAEKK